MTSDISSYLSAIDRDACYRVDAVLKESPFETTERVYFVGSNGAEQGPYVRKRFDAEAGMGRAYERLLEAQASGRRFLHVPRVYDCYDLGREHVVVMEFVAGETLADVVYRCDPSLALAADLFPRLCDAVCELHERFDPPLIHRDLKPSNVLVTADSLTLIDFGIARTYRAGAEEDTKHFGTRAYAPPEQFGFGQTDVRSDVYALGMLLYYCLTEKTPTAQAREEGFSELAALPAVRAVVETATALDPKGRFASARALKEAFMAAVGSANAPACQRETRMATVQPRMHVPRDPVVRKEVSMTVFVVRAVLAAMTLLLWVYGCTFAALNPVTRSTLAAGGMSEVGITTTYVLMGLAAVPVAWAIFDRKALLRRFPNLPKPLASFNLVLCAVAAFVLVFLAGFAGLVL